VEPTGPDGPSAAHVPAAFWGDAADLPAAPEGAAPGADSVPDPSWAGKGEAWTLLAQMRAAVRERARDWLRELGSQEPPLEGGGAEVSADLAAPPSPLRARPLALPGLEGLLAAASPRPRRGERG
jgi:hypothetical protein